MVASYGYTRRVLKKHLHLHLIKITSVHELKEGDNIKSFEYCHWFRDVITAIGEDILDNTFFTDVWFHITIYTNSHVWSAPNLHEIKNTPLHNQTVGMLCTISQNQVISHIFFDDTVTPNVIEN
jgi:hypothetical protein